MRFKKGLSYADAELRHLGFWVNYWRFLFLFSALDSRFFKGVQKQPFNISAECLFGLDGSWVGDRLNLVGNEIIRGKGT